MIDRPEGHAITSTGHPSFRLFRADIPSKTFRNISQLDDHWKKFASVGWPREVFDDIEIFWIAVYSHQNASETRDFKEVG